MHVVFDVASKVGEAVPLGHFIHDDNDPEPMEEEYVPSGHGIHCVSNIAPVPSKYFPCPQGMHCSLPCKG